MRAFSYCGHFRSRDNDDTIRSAMSEKLMLFYIAGIGIFDIIAPVLLTMTQRHSYKLDPYSFEIYRMRKYQLPTSRLLKVIV